MVHRSAFRSFVIPVLLVVIGALIGSATIVAASSSSNAPIFRLGDATEQARLATVDTNGSLYVTQQGTVTVSVTNSDFPDAGTHSRLDTANAQLGKLNFDGNGNLRTASQGTSQISGSVSVSNFPSDQQVHGTVTVTNPGASGITTIMVAQTGVISGGFATWDGIDVSSCRSFSVAVTVSGTGLLSGHAENLHIYTWTDAVKSAQADVHEKDGAQEYNGSWGILAYPTQPGTNEPFYTTAIGIQASNGDSQTRDMSATVYCQH